MENEIKVNPLQPSADTLRKSIHDSVLQFINDTGIIPSVSIETRSTETQCGAHINVKVDVEVTVNL